MEASSRLACGGDEVGVDPERGHQLVVEDDLGLDAVGHGTDRELGLVGRADLAHEGDIEGCRKRARNLGRDRHAAARQGEHERGLEPQGGQTLGQQSAGLGSVRECQFSAHGRARRNIAPLQALILRKPGPPIPVEHGTGWTGLCYHTSATRAGRAARGYDQRQ